MSKKEFFLKKEVKPIRQGIIVLIALIGFNILAYLIQLTGIDLGRTISWEISLTLMLFFAIANTMFFLNTNNKSKYWIQSISTYLTLLIISVLIAKWSSGFGLNEAGSIKWIYFVFTFGYLVFVSIIGMMRRIVEMAIKQDKKLRGEQ